MLDVSNVIKAHCYVISMLDKFIVSRYVAELITDCRTFWSHRPLSTAYKTTGPERPQSGFKFATHVLKVNLPDIVQVVTTGRN